MTHRLRLLLVIGFLGLFQQASAQVACGPLLHVSESSKTADLIRVSLEDSQKVLNVFSNLDGTLKMSVPTYRGQKVLHKDVALADSAPVIAVRTKFNKITTYDLESGKALATLSFFPEVLSPRKFRFFISPDGQKLILLREPLARVYDVKSGEALHDFKLRFGQSTNTVPSFSAGGQFFTVRMQDAYTGVYLDSTLDLLNLTVSSPEITVTP